jgi:4-amino-4-deoxy-L-arabinose transferase-like glycosyltransferase
LLVLYPSALLPKRQTLLLLFCILAVAAALRFAALGSVPNGVWLDEALKGIEGIESVRTGHFQIFYPANNGREGLWIAVIGYSESIFGVNQFGLRFASALVGTLTVLFIFLLTREFYSDRVALLAAWFTATGFWHVLFSRLAFRGILVPLLLSASIYFFVRAERSVEDPKPRFHAAWLFAAIGGIFFGLGFHSYIAFRVTPLLVALIFLFELMRRRKLSRPIAPWLKIFSVWLLAAILVALPIGIYFLHHPQEFEGRAKEVSIFTDQHPERVEVKVLLRTLGMFNFHGDKNWRHNYGGRPELLAPVGIFFLAGIVLTVVRVRRSGWSARAEWLLLAWFAVLLVPELLSAEGTPHALRAIGVISPVYILAALGADLLWIQLQRNRALSFAMLMFVLGVGGYDAWKYFHDYARHGALAGNQSFNQLQASEGTFLNSLPASTPHIVVYEDSPSPADAILPSFGRVDYKLPMDAEPLVFATYDRPVTLVSLQDEINVLDAGRKLPAGNVIVPLEGRQQTLEELIRHGAALDLHRSGSVVYATSR